jgi:nucleoid DNA-binding protein
MADKTKGRDQLIVHLQATLPPVIEDKSLTKKEADAILGVVISAIEQTLLDNLHIDGFSLKLNSFAKLKVHHRAGILRKIPFSKDEKGDYVVSLTKDKRKIKFVTLGRLRQKEDVKENQDGEVR